MLDAADQHEFWEPFCFFLTSVGYTIGWTAISSMLASFKRQFGPEVLLQLNMAYFLPSIPVLFLQTQYDARFNHEYGLPQATAARMILGLGGAGLVCGLFPFVAPSLQLLLFLTCLLGICCGVAFGCSYQLVSHFSIPCNVALTIGFVGSGPIVLLLEVIDKVGPHPTQSQRILLYSVVVPFFTFLGLVAALLLLHWHWDDLTIIGKRKLSGDMEGGVPLLETGDSQSRPMLTEGISPAGSNARLNETAYQAAAHPSGRALHRQTWQLQQTEENLENLSSEATAQHRDVAEASGTLHLAQEVWPAALALGVSVGCATLFFPFFTYCPSSGWLQALLPQVLFFARTISDILGRLIPHSYLGLDTRRGLHVMTVVKLLVTPLGFYYIRSAPVRSDAAAVLFVSLFWLQSGVVNSASFVAANRWASPGLRERAGGFLALTFQTSCLVALALAFWIQKSDAAFSSE